MTKTFDGIKFKGVFRNYQQSVIDNSEKFLSDGRINIVAAPGSGKTILGLELIRRLGFPCIILSPTTTIRHQWGQRFEECFLPENENIDDYVSYDLNEITLINSITYQSLHSCIAKVKTESDDETIDYSNIDIFKLVQKSGIKIICLDESHHLKNEWQKSLEFFLKALGNDVIIISLTATPPYDATAGEWKRYIGACGEIDDEIFVPELVKDGTLCPHQDYIYFNLPSEKEREIINLNRTENQQAVNEIYNLPFLPELAARIEAIKNTKETYFYENFYQFKLVLSYLVEKNKCDKRFYKKLTGTRSSEWITVKRIEDVIQFLIDAADLCYEDEKKIIIEILRKHHAYLHNKVCLTLSDSIQKKLVSSTGKLHSITKIAGAEYESLGENLRLLILADYIKKESVSEIGKGYSIDNISVVSIFNELYQNTKIKIGVVSGSVVILPSSLEKMILKNGHSVLASAINKTGYSIYTIAGGNKEKMALASFLFEEGYVNILIGTQALLGEGWDSPCINSLILASYVGSFMLSNQMRGRAIRAYSKNPKKTANIWHLVTLEPNDFYGCDECVLESSGDFETLKRRFECFVGPDYTTGEVTSGIERVSILKKPFDKNEIEKINRMMIEYSKDREKLRGKWEKVLESSAKIRMVDKIPKKKKMPVFTFVNMMSLVIVLSMQAMIRILLKTLKLLSTPGKLIYYALTAYFLFLTVQWFYFTFTRVSPKRSVNALARAVLKTFQQLNLINPQAHLYTSGTRYETLASLDDASIHEQTLFTKAMKELYSFIDNPKYVIVKRGNGFLKNKYDYRISFACPEEFAKSKRARELLEENLSAELGGVSIVRSHTEFGWMVMNNCVIHSFISRNDELIKRVMSL